MSNIIRSIRAELELGNRSIDCSNLKLANFAKPGCCCSAKAKIFKKTK